MSTQDPGPIRPGDPITAARLMWLQRGSVQRVLLAGGTASKVGSTLILEPGKGRGGGSAAGQRYGIITDCLADQLVTVQPKGGTWPGTVSNDGDPVTAIRISGEWAKTGDAVWLIPVSGFGNVEWRIESIIDYDERTAQSGDYDAVTSAPLAPFQLEPSVIACE